MYFCPFTNVSTALSEGYIGSILNWNRPKLGELTADEFLAAHDLKYCRCLWPLMIVDEVRLLQAGCLVLTGKSRQDGRLTERADGTLRGLEQGRRRRDE
jgi:hypothetical protein